MKLIKLAFAMVAAMALAGSVAQAQIPATFAVTAGYEDGSTASINNNTILSKVASYLNIKLPVGSKLAFNTNGALVIIDSAKNIVLDLSAGTNASDFFKTNVTPGIDGGFVTNVVFVEREVGTSFDEGLDTEFLFFYDPIWTGSTTFDDESLTTSSLFKLTGKAIAGASDDDEFGLLFETETFTTRSDQFGSNETETGSAFEFFEFADGAKATLSVSLKAGVYTLSFVINCSGETFRDVNDSELDGDLFGTLSASGTQTGGSSFLDPFNGFGNYSEDFSTF